ncbi:MAG TPA: hypothetical protein P5307_08230 [Pirellulaceae bacterium]|nr:hypothetical protein [Planctomycetales bacterium]MCB9940761.1 hypothetical protein [Planctomycetaceae bacterium]HRX79036.1 hypothetical protein [Pirellulaceae bacterium]
MESPGHQPKPDVRESNNLAPAESDASTPGSAQVFQYLLYGLSLPERALRATSAIVGGTLTESAALLVPQAFRSSKSYEVFVQQMLNLMVQDVGGIEVPDAEKSASDKVESFVARKAVGSFLDLAGMATLHLSPLTVLAIVSDVAYGSQSYLKELSAELKKAGIIDEETTIDHAADLLDAIRNTSTSTANAFDLPPLSVEGLRETIEQTRRAVQGIDPTKVIPEAEMRQIWTQMHEVASRQDVGLLDVSSTMTLFAIDKVGRVGQGALSSVTVAGNMFDRHIFDHYRQGLTEIQKKGLYATLATASQPYIRAVWTNFSSERETITEDLFSGKLIGRVWTGVRSWFADEAPLDNESNS